MSDDGYVSVIAIALMSKTPRGNPTPSPIAWDLSDVVPWVGGGIKAAEVVGEVVCVVDVKEVVVATGRHIPTAVFAI